MCVYLHGLSTALPEHHMSQEDVRARAETLFGGTYPQFDRLARSFASAGIDHRYSVVPIDWFSRPHGWKDRNAAFLDGATAMFLDAAGQALADAGWSADERRSYPVRPLAGTSTANCSPYGETDPRELRSFRERKSCSTARVGPPVYWPE